MSNRTAQPTAAGRSVDGIQRPAQPTPSQTSKWRDFKPKRSVFLGLSVLLVGTIGLLVAWQLGYIGNLVKSDRLQAVFLTNGQVYYGKLHGDKGKYVRLSDVYYLKGNSAATTSTPTTQQLVKLGTEIHGPDAEMMIRSDQVLFFENLRNDSSIVTAIKNNDKQ